MSIKVRKKIAILMAIVMVMGIAQLSPISASENTGGKIAHNLASNQIPFIYCLTNDGKTETLKAGNTVIPFNTYRIIAYIKSTNIDVDKQKSKINVNGQALNVSWGSSNEGYYATATFDVNSGIYNDVNMNIQYSYKRNFSVRARKIITSNSSGATEMEKILNNNPATYQLYDKEQKVYLEGTINTAIDSYTNFIHWKQISGQGQYITDDDTYIRNLPNGEYTLTEMDPGKGLKTENMTSSSVWLNSSVIKESRGRKYYTFTINDETANEWMNACVNEGQSNSLFYGFYLENLKTTFNVTYDGNGYNQGTMKSHTNIEADEKIKLTENQFIRWGYTFAGWNTVANPTQENPGVSYSDSSEMVVKSDTVLYAQWKKDLKVSHDVYLYDKTKEDNSYTLLDSKTSNDSNLAFSQEELDTILSNHLNEGYKYIETIIEVKKDGSDIWETYQSNTVIEDKTQVRYILVVDKDLQQTKTLSYNVEYWLEGEDTPRDSETVTKKVWINDKTTKLEVKEIIQNNYEGYEFSHYNPTDLPTTIENESTIKVYYKKIQTPVIPDEPTDPDTPVTPDVPESPVVPEIPTNPIVPETPNIIAPIAPIIPVAPTIPPVNNIVRNVVRNPNVAIEDNEVPTNNGTTENIEDTEIPQASGKTINQGAWALVNLICVMLTILIGLLAIILKHRKEEKQEKSLEKSNNNDIYVRRRWTKGLSIIVSVVSVIIFILTENMSLPMVMTDKWTILMVVIVLVQVIVYIVSTHFKKDKDEKEPQVAYNQ